MRLKDWNTEERPREKLLLKGPGALGNAELLAIFIGSGVPGANAVSVAQELLSSAGGRLSELCRRPAKQLMRQRGVGQARAVAIAAALELGRRYLAEAAARQPTVNGPEDVVDMMLPILKGLDHEECWALYLNRANVVTGKEKLTSGTADCTLIDNKQILRRVLDEQAKAVILVHNHPSGSPLPGESDLKATRSLQLALKAFDISLFDHVIIADGAYNNFIAEMRDATIQKDRLRFRTNLERVGEIFAYEISKELTYSEKDVATPLGIARVATCDTALVISTILRAGLPLQKGVFNFFDHAETAFLAAFRKYGAGDYFEIRADYCTTPSLEGKTLILADTMLATGSSIEVAIDKLRQEGGEPIAIHLVCPIASTYAVDHLSKIFGDEVTLWVAAVDEELTSHSYIVPGLGDAGDLAFGDKL